MIIPLALTSESKYSVLPIHVSHSLFRTEQNQLKDIKFDYVCGSGRLFCCVYMP